MQRSLSKGRDHLPACGPVGWELITPLRATICSNPTSHLHRASQSHSLAHKCCNIAAPECLINPKDPGPGKGTSLVTKSVNMAEESTLGGVGLCCMSNTVSGVIHHSFTDPTHNLMFKDRTRS